MAISKVKYIVISGCSGGGKSSLLEALANVGYTTVPEVGRQIVEEQLESKGSVTPWDNPLGFCEMLIAKSIEAYHAAKSIEKPKDGLVFFDRSFLDGVSYYKTLHTLDPKKYDHFIDELRYDSTVFMTPPWPEIFCHDAERQHSFEVAVEEYHRLMVFYPYCGYQVVEIPRISIKERVQFIQLLRVDS